MERKKRTLQDFFRMKKEKQKIVVLSVPDATTAYLAEQAGVDMVIVGGSLAMVLLGHPTTIPLTMDDMVRMCQAVRRGAPNTFMLAPITYQAYQTPEMALRNAARLMQETGADAVKIQGGVRMKHILKAITDAGMPCASHVGLTHHNIAKLGGFKIQGKSAEDAMRVYEDAMAIQEAGGFGMEVEAVPPPVAEQISKDLDIIAWGVGAGSECDGQNLIAWDMLGFYDRLKTKFTKRYANLAETAVQAMTQYAAEVRERRFPTAEFSYTYNDEEIDKFRELILVDRSKAE